MTKLRIMSDLHLEFGAMPLDLIGEDILVLAGDIGIGTSGAEWARDYARQHDIPVVMIAGNHEFYRQEMNQTIQDLYNMIEEGKFIYLNDDISTVKGVQFVGCTLWTDYELNNTPTRSMILAQQSMNDHRLINVDGNRFTVQEALDRHNYSVGVLRERLPRNYQDGATPLVVMTHHLPSARSIADRYANSEYNAAYASNLDDLVANSGAALWVHGHTHVSQDYQINHTRVLCNPRGYDGYELNPDFNPNLIVEI